MLDVAAAAARSTGAAPADLAEGTSAMRDEYWPLAEAVARDLAERRADSHELAQASHYLNAHRDAADFFAFLDELAGPAGAVLARSGQTASHLAAVRDAC